MLNHRIQGTVLVIGRTAKLDPRVAFSYHLLFELLHQAGFADARLPRSAVRPVLPRLSPAPSARSSNPTSSSRPPEALSQCGPPPQSDSGLHSLPRPDTPPAGLKSPSMSGAKVLTLKQALYEPIGGGADHHGIGLSHPLHPGGEIGCLAQG